MRNIDDCRPYVENLRLEHCRLDQIVREVQAALAKLVQSQRGPQDVVQRLTRLRDELDRHYAEEEEGGCLEEAECRSPSVAPEVRRVKCEHNALRLDMDRLVALAQTFREPLADLVELDQQFRQFAARLKKHEAAENRIIVYGFGSEAMDEFTEDPNSVDSGPCACETNQPDAAP
jgi:hemerythrin-like domain-containing protein